MTPSDLIALRCRQIELLSSMPVYRAPSRTSTLPAFAPRTRPVPEPVAPRPYYEKKE